MALAGVEAGVGAGLKGTEFGCLRFANLPEGREASVGAGRIGLERDGGVESSKKGSKRFEVVDLYGGEDASACEDKLAGSGGDGWRAL